MGNFISIFVQITLLCAFRHAAARRHFTSDQRLLSDKCPLQIVKVYGIYTFTRQRNKNKATQFGKPNKYGTHSHVFPHDRSFEYKYNGLTCLALMRLVTTPPERSAITKVVYNPLNIEPNPHPLRCDVENLNEHFANTVIRTVLVTPVDSKASLMDNTKSLNLPENTGQTTDKDKLLLKKSRHINWTEPYFR